MGGITATDQVYERAYKNALERAKKLHSESIIAKLRGDQEKIEQIFPELRESEDERIRRELIEYLKQRSKSGFNQEVKICNNGIAWLEKQGENKDQRHSILDELIEADDIYQMSVNDAMVEEAKNKAIDALSKLGISKLLGLEKQGHDGKKWIYEDVYLKEKEQLIQNGIDEVLENPQKYGLEKQGEQPSWSEEDEKMKSLIISTLTSMGTLNLERYHHMNLDEVKNWLKSIKDRVQPQPRQEWSEEDSERLLRIHQFIWANRKGDTDEIYQQEQDADWLMTLNHQPKQEWSKKDEDVWRTLLFNFENMNRKYLWGDGENCYAIDIVNFLKSLKPQSHWKPSEEQMEALNAINNIGELSYIGQSDLLIKLYNDLKNL